MKLRNKILKSPPPKISHGATVVSDRTPQSSDDSSRKLPPTRSPSVRDRATDIFDDDNEATTGSDPAQLSSDESSRKLPLTPQFPSNTAGTLADFHKDNDRYKTVGIESDSSTSETCSIRFEEDAELVPAVMTTPGSSFTCATMDLVDQLITITLDESDDDTSDTEEDPVADDAFEVVLEFPPGAKMGLTLATDSNGNCLVADINKQRCFLDHLIKKGDHIVSVGEFATHGMSLERVSQEIRRMRQSRRVIRLRRSIRRVDASVQNCANEGSGAERTGATLNDRAGNGGGRSARGTTSRQTIGHADGEDNNDDGDQEEEEEGIRSRLVRVHAQAEAAKMRQSATEKKKQSAPQKVGKKASRFGQLHGKGAEGKKRTFLNHFFEYANMVEMVETLESGESTTGWEEIIPFVGIYDPYKYEIRKGRAGGHSSSSYSTKPRLTFVARSSNHVEDIKVILSTFVNEQVLRGDEIKSIEVRFASESTGEALRVQTEIHPQGSAEDEADDIDNDNVEDFQQSAEDNGPFNDEPPVPATPDFAMATPAPRRYL